ncbi:Acyltransferase-like protein [Apostasia shenzhenica]|uniref:Acyltransferase-like protein n=1 Tax=Apostasia shenzhenica TaxID=1088818 RepID=A0A2I0APA1_9ASPA|nr:Acyltransferase-like protein [Apostasia shenzhenica]
MAARFGASIVPFGAVGEDDFLELFLDYDDLMSMPCTRRTIFQTNQKLKNLSSKAFGDERSQDLYWPWFLPKIPGRIYYLFGKPISTGGSVDLMEREAAKAMYWRVKSEVESSISYLINKRGEDQYRSIFQRALFQAAWGPSKQIPSFEP